jgi:hypothetical protein
MTVAQMEVAGRTLVDTIGEVTTQWIPDTAIAWEEARHIATALTAEYEFTRRALAVDAVPAIVLPVDVPEVDGFPEQVEAAARTGVLDLRYVLVGPDVRYVAVLGHHEEDLIEPLSRSLGMGYHSDRIKQSWAHVVTYEDGTWALRWQEDGTSDGFRVTVLDTQAPPEVD